MVTYIDKKKSAACDSGIQALAYAFIAKFGSLKKAPEGRIAVALGATETVNQHEPAGELQDHWLCPEGNKYEQIHCSSRTFFLVVLHISPNFSAGSYIPDRSRSAKPLFPHGCCFCQQKPGSSVFFSKNLAVIFFWIRGSPSSGIWCECPVVLKDS